MSCCGAPSGFVQIWQHIVDGKVVAERDTQAEINAVKASAGGTGRTQRVTRKKP